jgi:hypothetical protein
MTLFDFSIRTAQESNSRVVKQLVFVLPLRRDVCLGNDLFSFFSASDVQSLALFSRDLPSGFLLAILCI